MSRTPFCLLLRDPHDLSFFYTQIIDLHTAVKLRKLENEKLFFSECFPRWSFHDSDEQVKPKTHKSQARTETKHNGVHKTAMGDAVRECWPAAGTWLRDACPYEHAQWSDTNVVDGITPGSAIFLLSISFLFHINQRQVDKVTDLSPTRHDQK